MTPAERAAQNERIAAHIAAHNAKVKAHGAEVRARHARMIEMGVSHVADHNRCLNTLWREVQEHERDFAHDLMLQRLADEMALQADRESLLNELTW